MAKQELFIELEQELRERELSKDELSKLKVRLCGKHKVTKVPTDIEVLLNLKNPQDIKTELKTKPIRSGSGVAIIAVMCAPKGCPHGKCTFCPGGPGSVFGSVPQSYTGKEPSTMRAIRNNYDPYLVVMNRLEQYIVMGHIPEKGEVIIQGGTFPALKKEFQEDFVKSIFKAMNDFSELFYNAAEFDFEKFKEFFELPGDIRDDDRRDRIHAKLNNLKQEKESTLQDEQNKNETSHIKCVALTIETKPDWSFLEHGNHMLKLGCTRLEIGVQSTFDLPLKLTNRGHDVKDTIRSLKEMKDLGFKINAHYMPGLPGVESYEQDLEGMKALFSNPDFRPDMLKVYPCMVFPGTELFNDFKEGKFKPMSTSEAASIIADFKEFVPPYCRIMRVQRDIPSFQVEAGVKKTNLRQYVDELCLERGIKCRCIRCREPNPREPQSELGEVKIKIIEYLANKGEEYFISVENDRFILGLCRLRFPSQALRSEITESSALIRELHVYGEAAAIGGLASVQHKGLGKMLMEKAEEIARSKGKEKMVVISGIGVRGYYKSHLGYHKEGVYMVKML
jgi:elongator complex protein 3